MRCLGHGTCTPDLATPLSFMCACDYGYGGLDCGSCKSDEKGSSVV